MYCNVHVQHCTCTMYMYTYCIINQLYTYNKHFAFLSIFFCSLLFHKGAAGQQCVISSEVDDVFDYLVETAETHLIPLTLVYMYIVLRALCVLNSLISSIVSAIS